MAGDTGRVAVTLSFLALLLVGGVGAAMTQTGHMTHIRRSEITGEVVSYSLQNDDPLTIRATVRVRNPTPGDVEVTAPGSTAAYLDGDRVAVIEVPTYSPTTVPSGGATTKTYTFTGYHLNESSRQRVRAAVRNDRLQIRGLLRGRIGNKNIAISIERTTPTND